MSDEATQSTVAETSLSQAATAAGFDGGEEKKKKHHHHHDDDDGEKKKKHHHHHDDDDGEKKKKHHHDDSAPASAPAAPVAAQVTPSDGRKKILIVEDERPLAHALELKLSHDGYATATAADGVNGLEQAKQGTFDLMLLDLILPGMDGFEVLRQLKESGSTMPVVILSNLGQEEDRARVQDYGVAQYCVKSNMPLAAIVNTIKVLTA